MRSHSVRFYKKFRTKSDNSNMSIQEYFYSKPWKSIETKTISYFRSQLVSPAENLSTKLP